MKVIVKRALAKFAWGKKWLEHLKIQKEAFQAASQGCFRYLDSPFRKKKIDEVYSKAFDEIFVLLKSLPVDGDIFEFGVYAGYSSRFLARYVKKFGFDTTSLHLFDSFAGLPKEKELDFQAPEFACGAWKEGAMRVPLGLDQYIKKKLSRMMGREVFVIKGFFDKTLEPYFSTLEKPKAKLVYIDCDLYSSTKCVLEALFRHDVLQDGTILIFDDWMTSRGNPELGQRKATEEVFKSNPSWSLEKYSHFGVGSHVFIVHSLSRQEA